MAVTWEIGGEMTGIKWDSYRWDTSRWDKMFKNREKMGEWKKQAACISADTDLFYSFPGEVEKRQQALIICAGCPVRRECLKYALDNNEDHGIWGMTTERQRDRIRLSRRLAG